MPADDTDLTALIGSRICHDLISPLGAVSNGLELLEMSGQARTPEVALIADSIASANARIRFFRVAYGAAAHGVSLSRAEVASILDDSYRGSRLSVVWEPAAEAPRRDVKIAFLALQCLETAMPYGGEVVISRSRSGTWEVTGRAPKMKIDPTLWAALADPSRRLDLTSALVHFGILREVTRPRTPPLTVAQAEGRITIAF
jgi:histidine phosphotransferase ChpT